MIPTGGLGSCISSHHFGFIQTPYYGLKLQCACFVYHSFLRSLNISNIPGIPNKLLSIKSDLDPVVEEGKEGGEGEGGDEDGDEPELENHLEVLLEQALVVHQPVVGVDLGEPLP